MKACMRHESDDFEIVRDSVVLTFARIVDQPTVKIWNLLGPSQPYRCGQIILVRNEIAGLNADVWSVANIWVWFDLQGKGIMREFIPQLLRHVYPICSDIHGTTSPHAIKMWQALDPIIIEDPKNKNGEPFKAKRLYILFG